jgi:hypothetical protein
MTETLPLKRMTTRQKLAAMEALWSDLTRRADTFRSPEWHGKVLEQRRARVESGTAKFIPWQTAKAQLRKRLK